MGKIVGHFPIYNAAQWLMPVIFEIQEYIDEIIVIDGSWRVYVALGLYDSFASNDGSLELLKSLDLTCKLKIIDSPKFGWVSHARKRAEISKFLKKDDWRFLMEADEVPFGNVEAGLKELGESKDACGYIRMIEPRFDPNVPSLLQSLVMLKPRFHRWQDNLRMGFLHTDFFRAKEDGIAEFREAWPSFEIKNFNLLHMRHFKPPYLIERREPSLINFTDVHLTGSMKMFGSDEIVMDDEGPNYMPNVSQSVRVTDSTKTTFIIPVYNQKELLIKCLKDIRTQEDDQIIIVDDGSTDGTKSKIKDIRKVRYIRQKHQDIKTAVKTGILAAETFDCGANIHIVDVEAT